jgi:hypothetical protein
VVLSKRQTSISSEIAEKFGNDFLVTGRLGQRKSQDHPKGCSEVGNCCGHVRKGLTGPHRNVSLDVFTMYKYRHSLAGMVRAFRRRVVKMVGRDDEDVLAVHPLEHFRQTLIEGFQCIGIAAGIVAVTVVGIEINQIGEDETRLAYVMNSRFASTTAMLLPVWLLIVKPRWAKMSSIFPTPSTSSPEDLTMSRIVGEGGSRLKSRLRSVR